MLQLNLAYVEQATREREVETDLQTRQLLRPSPTEMIPTEAPAPRGQRTRRAPVGARAAGR